MLNQQEMLQDLFPDHKVSIDFKNYDMVFSKSKKVMQFDVAIPTLQLVFEYQGQQHYEKHFKYGSPEELQQRDKEKKEMCINKGLTLIEIPYLTHDMCTYGQDIGGT